MSHQTFRTAPVGEKPSHFSLEPSYHDLARMFSPLAGKDLSTFPVPATEIIAHLTSCGHKISAIKWLLHLAVKHRLLEEVKLSDEHNLNSPNLDNASIPREGLGFLATELFFNSWHEVFAESQPKEFVLLIPGIRTFAYWQPTVKRVLEELPHVTVLECNYGYFNALKFWCPFLTRGAPIAEVRAELEKAMTTCAQFPNGRLSVIAHSFGTYVISKLLLDMLNLRLHRLVLCGSIIRRTYPWHALGDRISKHQSRPEKRNILNDFGLRDVWPVMAKCLSWGYGDTGRHKFGKAEVFDRAHDLAHNDYFAKGEQTGEKFVRTYWQPWFARGEVVSSPVNEGASSPIWLSLLSILPLQWIMISFLVFAIVYTLFGGAWFWSAAELPRLDWELINAE